MSDPQPTEEQIRAYEEELSRLSSIDIVLQAAATLISIGGHRLGLGGRDGDRDLEQARDAIDGARALLPIIERRMPAAQIGQLKAALSQLQMGYASLAQGTGAGADAPGGAEPAAAAPAAAAPDGAASDATATEGARPGRRSRAAAFGCQAAERASVRSALSGRASTGLPVSKADGAAEGGVRGCAESGGRGADEGGAPRDAEGAPFGVEVSGNGSASAAPSPRRQARGAT